MGWIYVVNTKLWSLKCKSSFKNNQPSNIMKLGWVPYELCLLLPSERVTDMELGGFVDLINGLGIWNG